MITKADLLHHGFTEDFEREGQDYGFEINFSEGNEYIMVVFDIETQMAYLENIDEDGATIALTELGDKWNILMLSSFISILQRANNVK